jgi:hypothetical protein
MLNRMNSVSTTPPFRKKRLQAYRGRGDIYAWLRTHCHTVAERLAADQTSWVFIAEEMIRHGVSGRSGEAPTANAVLRVWKRVCRDMETTGERPGVKTSRLPPPSRYPEWSPPVLSEREIPVPAYLRPPGEIPPYLRPPSTLPAVASPAAAPVPQPQQAAGTEVAAKPAGPEPGTMEFAMAQLRKGDWYLNPGGKREP